jgi:cell wall-associated NlpC family hydrolase
MSEKGEFVRELIGKPWSSGAEGPAAFDCWGLVKYVSKMLYDTDLPDLDRPFNFDDDMLLVRSEAQGWRQIQGPKDGAIAFMGAPAIPRHVGIFVAIPPGPGSVLHADERHGAVAFESVATLRVLRGWSQIRWYAKI